MLCSLSSYCRCATKLPIWFLGCILMLRPQVELFLTPSGLSWGTAAGLFYLLCLDHVSIAKKWHHCDGSNDIEGMLHCGMAELLGQERRIPYQQGGVNRGIFSTGKSRTDQHPQALRTVPFCLHSCHRAWQQIWKLISGNTVWI